MSCPRCRSSETALMARSSPKGAWEIHLCQTCFYGWRTSEPESVVNPTLYDARFRLAPDQIAGFKEFPMVAPPRKNR